MTYWHYYAINAQLLVWPRRLCCDWSMGAVPVVRSWSCLYRPCPPPPFPLRTRPLRSTQQSSKPQLLPSVCTREYAKQSVHRSPTTQRARDGARVWRAKRGGATHVRAARHDSAPRAVACHARGARGCQSPQNLNRCRVAGGTGGIWRRCCCSACCAPGPPAWCVRAQRGGRDRRHASLLSPARSRSRPCCLPATCFSQWVLWWPSASCTCPRSARRSSPPASSGSCSQAASSGNATVRYRYCAFACLRKPWCGTEPAHLWLTSARVASRWAVVLGVSAALVVRTRARTHEWRTSGPRALPRAAALR